MAITYDKYAELLSRIINGVTSDKDRDQVKNFEAANPRNARTAARASAARSSQCASSMTSRTARA